MIGLAPVYALLGGFMLFAAVSNLRRAERGSINNAAFWALLGSITLVADWLPAIVTGAAIVAAAAIAASGRMRGSRTADAATPIAASFSASVTGAGSPFGNRIFIPALLIPAITVTAVLAFKAAERAGNPMATAQHATLLALALACVAATLGACAMTREPAPAPLREGSRLLDAIGWAAILPLLLAMLGTVFAQAGVGEIVAELMRAWIPTDNRLACVLAYALGMALFTMLMGNAFAAFPVITAGIGLPLLVQQHGADAASLAAIGMLSGYCGTLLTPMAANYNLVPAALLELPDRNAVIREQVATALPLLACNIALMYLIPFRTA